MIDYLELLLETQEQEEDGQTLEWKKPGCFKLKPPAQTQTHLADKDLSGEDVSDTDDAETALTQCGKTDLRRQAIWIKPYAVAYTGESFDRERNPRATAELRNRRRTAQPMLAEIMRLHRAVRQADVQARQRTILDTNAAVGSNHAVWDLRWPSSKPVNYAALVDTVFSRDARRYDGPLGLL